MIFLTKESGFQGYLPIIQTRKIAFFWLRRTHVSIGCLPCQQMLRIWAMPFAPIGESKTKSIGRKDVTFNEDHCPIRSCHSPRNLALLRRMALNALNQETTLKRSLRQKMKRAAMNNDYMMTVLQSFCQ